MDKSAHQYVQAYGFTLHFHHGDSLRYNGGIGGLTIPAMKRLPRWDGVRKSHYHNIGHFHTYSPAIGPLTVNGSLIGYNEYAQDIGAEYEAPAQAFYLVDSERGRTGMYPIWCAPAEPLEEVA